MYTRSMAKQQQPAQHDAPRTPEFQRHDNGPDIAEVEESPQVVEIHKVEHSPVVRDRFQLNNGPQNTDRTPSATPTLSLPDTTPPSLDQDGNEMARMGREITELEKEAARNQQERQQRNDALTAQEKQVIKDKKQAMGRLAELIAQRLGKQD